MTNNLITPNDLIDQIAEKASSLDDIAQAGTNITFTSSVSEPAFTIEGSGVTITDKIATGFDYNTYIIATASDEIIQDESFEIGIKVKCDDFSLGDFLGSNDVDEQMKIPYIKIDDGEVTGWFSNSGDYDQSYSTQITTTGADITEGSWVWIRVTGTYIGPSEYKYEIYVSKTGEFDLSSTHAEVMDTGVVLQLSKLCLGAAANWSEMYNLDGSIDLNETYIKINNEIVWTPYTASNNKAIINATVPTVDQVYSGVSTNAQSGVAVKQAVDAAVSSVYKPAGSVAFSGLPTLSASYEGYVYNINEEFTTNANFVEGAGKTYPAGTNVVCIDVGSSTYKWDVLAGYIAPTHLTDLAIAGTGITFTQPFTSYTVVGSPTIDSNYVASGFSDSSYLIIPNYLNDASSSFELVTSINLSSNTNGVGIFDNSNTSGSLPNLRLTVDGGNGTKVRFRISTDGSSTFPIDITGTTSLATSTKYWIKATYNSSTGYALYMSTDGSSWTIEGTSSTTTRPYSSSYDLKIGDNAAPNLGFTGSIYLQDTYINVNGSRVWAAYDSRTKISGSSVDQTYNAASTNAQSGVAIAGAGFLKNTATGSNSLTVIGSASNKSSAVNIGNASTALGDESVSIGSGNGSYNATYQTFNEVAAGTRSIAIGIRSTATGPDNTLIGINRGTTTNSTSGSVVVGNSSTKSFCGSYCTFIGYDAKTTGTPSYAIAIGSGAIVANAYGIQLGYGTNSTANTFSVGLSSSSNYTLLESDGTIPDARLKSDVLINTATGTKCLTVGGTASTSDRSTNIGVESVAVGTYSVAVGRLARALSGGNFSVAIGAGATVNYNASGAIAIGCDAKADQNAVGAIVLGRISTNAEANTFKVGFPTGNTTAVDESTGLYTLLDGTTGKIPTGRYIVMTGADGTNAGTTGSVPAPAATDNTKFLRGDGTWQTVSSGSGSKETYTNPALTTSNNICTWTVTHTLNTEDVIAQVYDTTTHKLVNADITPTSTSSITIELISNSDILANAYKVVIIG